MKFVAKAMMVALLLGGLARAQEPELVSEIVARVNNDIITRADYLNAVAEFRNELTRQMQQQGKSQAEIDAEFARLQPTVLDLLIDDLLLEQKAKEMGINVEDQVNQRMTEIAKQNNLPNALALEQALRQQGMDPEQARNTIRKQMLQESVINAEVMAPIYQGMKESELREFYEKNKEQFVIPGEVTLSEIFLPLEGYTAAEVEQRARRIVAELRAGMSFVEAVQKNSPATRPTRARDGRMGAFKPNELSETIAKAISTLKAGEVTDPLRLQDGYQIIRVDERKPSQTRPFEDKSVQDAIRRYLTFQKADAERQKFLARLRQEAYIDIDSKYATARARQQEKF